MKTLIVYYSRTKITKKVAEDLALKLGADIEQVIDTKNREGVVGYIMAGKDVVQKNPTTIMPTKYSASDYDLVIIGTPVWVGTYCPAIRAYAEAQKDNLKEVAFFATQGAAVPRQVEVFAKLEALSGKKSKANLHLSTKQVLASKYSEDLAEFIKNLGFQN